MVVVLRKDKRWRNASAKAVEPVVGTKDQSKGPTDGKQFGGLTGPIFFTLWPWPLTNDLDYKYSKLYVRERAYRHIDGTDSITLIMYKL